MVIVCQLLIGKSSCCYRYFYTIVAVVVLVKVVSLLSNVVRCCCGFSSARKRDEERQRRSLRNCERSIQSGNIYRKQGEHSKHLFLSWITRKSENVQCVPVRYDHNRARKPKNKMNDQTTFFICFIRVAALARMRKFLSLMELVYN